MRKDKLDNIDEKWNMIFNLKVIHKSKFSFRKSLVINTHIQMSSNSYLYNSSGLRNQLAASNSVSNLNSFNKFNNNPPPPNRESALLGSNGMNRTKTGLGLNPNLNIEDEYVENLLKQIHFMNMEIKLLKQKQAQSDNNALWGIVNRTKQPLIKNIVESSQKYQQMKNNMDSQHQQLSADNIRLADLQNAILKQFQYLQTKLNSLKKKRQTLEAGFKQQVTKDKQKIKEYQIRLKSIIEEKQGEKKRNYIFQTQLDALLTETQKEQSKTAYQLSKIRNDQIIEEQMAMEKQQAILLIKNKTAVLKEKFLANQDYQRAQEEQKLLRQKIGNLEKGISGANFQLLQLSESIKLAETQTEKQIRQRKKLTQEYQAAKTMLLEISILNLGRKQKQTENRKRQSAEIQKGQYQTKKLQKNLDEIKKKLIKCEDTENQLRVEVEGLERDLEKLKSKRQELKVELTKLSSKNQQQDRTLLAYDGQVRKLQDQHHKISHEELLLTCQLQSIQKQIQYLRGRKDYLTQALNLKDTLDQTKLEDLQRVVQKNIDLNATVNMLMSKWEEIKVFSRM